MILSYAGRRAASLAGNIDQAAVRIRRLLAAVSPSAVVGAAADGADLIILEAALAASTAPTVHVVLPTVREVFAEDSVATAWRDRFEAVLEEVTRRGGTIRSLDQAPGQAAYQTANQAILDASADLAVDGQRAVALVVAREGEGQMIEHLVARARLRQIPVLRIDPAVDLTTRPRCFIAMPFGRKADTQRQIEVDCNQVYSKLLVPALENAQLNYRRADEEIDSGIVLEPMIEWVARSDLVIGDLGTSNFNVGWELGLRHVLRPGQTVLIGPAGTTAPFDLAALRHVRYRQDETGITDSDAIEAWAALAPYLARAGEPSPNDSPVATVMEVRQWGDVRRRTARDHSWESLRERVALARDLRDANEMLAVMDDAGEVSEEHHRLLSAEVGVGLVRLGRFEDAEPLLRKIVLADAGVQRPDAHVFYAQTLYRPVGTDRAALENAERVLKGVLTRRPGHPEVRAGLGAVMKKRLQLVDGPAAQGTDLRAALDYYRHDVERNLNLYYEGVNVVALGTALALTQGDEAGGRQARDLLPVVRVAARFAAERPEERYWALASIAECTLHEHLLEGGSDVSVVRAAYRRAGAERPPGGDLDSSLRQLDFLAVVGLPLAPLAQARAGLLEGAGR